MGDTTHPDELDRWHDDGGRDPHHHEGTTVSTATAPATAEKQIALGETMQELSDAERAVLRALDALDTATAKMIGRGANVGALDAAAVMVKEVRSKLIAVEKVLQQFALN